MEAGTGIPGPGDEIIAKFGRHERLERFRHGAAFLQRPPYLVTRVGSLHRDHREVAPRRERKLRVALGNQGIEPGNILVGGGRVDHDAESVLAQEVDNQIVEDPAVGPEQTRIERLALHG